MVVVLLHVQSMRRCFEASDAHERALGRRVFVESLLRAMPDMMSYVSPHEQIVYESTLGMRFRCGRLETHRHVIVSFGLRKEIAVARGRGGVCLVSENI